MAKPVVRTCVQDKEMKELSAEIHMGLFTLTQIYKTTPEFDKCFQPGMFIKSNPNAFPHIMHFLLHNLDPAEFNSRFLWPLHSDKAVEKEFRQKCIKYLNDLRKKHNMDMEEVGQYIAVVPGGVKFMKVLLEVVKLLQVEALKTHNCVEWLELPLEELFNDKFRADAQHQFACLQRVHQEVSQAAQQELKQTRKRTDMIKYYIKELESFVTEHPRDDTLDQEVAEMCGKMEQAMRLVIDIDKTCGPTHDQQNDPFERLHLSNAIARIAEHHKWIMTSEEYTHKINCSSILDVASRILKELAQAPIDARSVDPLELVNQNHDLELFLKGLSGIEEDLKEIQHRIRMDEDRHKEHEALHPKAKLIFPERDYPLIEIESCDLTGLYAELQRRPTVLRPEPFRLSLEDVIPDYVALSQKSLNVSTRDNSMVGVMSTSRRPANTTARKRTQAMSVLKTISRSNKRSHKSKVNMEALKGLARNGFNESMLDASTITWKKKSTRTETSVENNTLRSTAGPSTRLSGLFSDSLVVPKFNSTAIFNSTTNEQAQQLGDITNREPVAVAKERGEPSLLKQFQDMAVRTENQENLLDCSDSVLVE